MEVFQYLGSLLFQYYARHPIRFQLFRPGKYARRCRWRLRRWFRDLLLDFLLIGGFAALFLMVWAHLFLI